MTTLLARRSGVPSARLGPDHADIVASLGVLSLVELHSGNYDEAESLALQAVDMGERLFGSDDESVADSRCRLAEIRWRHGDQAGAEAVIRPAIDTYRRLFDPPHPKLFTSLDILGGILTIAGSHETVYQGMALLALYSAGLGIPFFLAGWSIEWFFSSLQKMKAHFRTVEIASGVLLVGLGLLVMTNSLTDLNAYFTFLNVWVETLEGWLL